MISTVNFYEFERSFGGSYENNFSYGGKKALFDYLEQLEKDIGEPIELDPVAFCCDYSEYSNAGEAASEYFEFEGMTYNEDGDELETAEEVEEKALDFLRDRTSVIEFEAGIIVQDF